MTSILSFPTPAPADSGPYEDDNRIFTPEAMDEADSMVPETAVAELAA